MAESGEIIIGIDLGTTNSCVARAFKIRENKISYEILENRVGKKTTPSMVTFTNEEILVGQSAKNVQLQHAEQTIYAAKRLIGHKYGDAEIQNLIKSFPFKVIPDSNDNPLIEVIKDGKPITLRPEEISALVLEEINKIVINKTGKAIDKCIITVPAYFNDLQRAATLEAAKIAKLNCLRLLNEPTAAAIAFQHMVNYEDGIVLVFDFGGGTLDVSILEVKDKNTFNILATSGDTALGGEDIDALLMEYVIKQFMKRNPGKDPHTNPRALALLKQKCEECKIKLSQVTSAKIEIASFYEGLDIDMTITRSNFEFICNEILYKLTDPIETALDEANLETDDITHLIMVGGSSHIPIVSKTVSDFFDDRLKPLSAVNPDEAIALGAAIFCQRLKTKDTSAPIPSFSEASKSSPTPEISPISTPPPDSHNDDEHEDDYIEVVETLSASIGIRNGQTRFVKYLSKNTPLPCEKEFQFRTTKDNQATAQIKVFTGEDEIIDPSNNTHKLIGEFSLSPLPRKPRGQVLMTVKMNANESGILTIEAFLADGGLQKQITITKF